MMNKDVEVLHKGKKVVRAEGGGPGQRGNSVAVSQSFTIMIFLLAPLTFVLALALAQQEIPPYVKQCHSDDPNLEKCIIGSIHHLRPYLAKGIEEIEMPTIEPFRLEELSLALTTGPNGYKITLKDMDIYGASNYTIKNIELAKKNSPFEAKIIIPKMDIEADYKSSGVLLIVPASGNGTFNGRLSDITAYIKGKVSKVDRDGEVYLNVDSLDFNMDIKTVRMTIKRAFKNNRILTEATNLFLRENGHEVLKAMMPQLRTKLASVFMKITNQLLSHIPLRIFYVTK